MSLFSRNRPATKNVRPARKDPSPKAATPQVTHRLTLDLSRANALAAMLASSRAARFIEISDLLAGFYIYEWDRLAEYWPEENGEEAEDFFRGLCKISPERWNYWIQLYDKKRRNGEHRRTWFDLTRKRKQKFGETAPEPSADLRAVFATAERISPFHDRPDQGELPVLTCECVLLCIAKYISTDMRRKLNRTGLDIEKLERAVIDPKRSPRG